MDPAVVDEGWRLLEAAEWAAARAEFERVLEHEESAEALDGLAQALWFEHEIPESIAARERAFDLYARAGACDRAARVAVWVSHQHAIAGRRSAARGWLARADRALENVGSCSGHGWVAVERARHAESVEECIEATERAMAVAHETGNADLEVFALSLLGRAHVAAGRWDTGIELLEEAMVTASAGRARDVHTVAEAYCNLVMACTTAGEWERATEWCEIVETFASERGLRPLFGACRTAHADVLLATGRWPEAEAALESALSAHMGHIPEMGAPTTAAMAELRVRQGRLPEAESLLAGREENASSLRALAQLRIAEGRPQVAAALLERGLKVGEDNTMRSTGLLALLVDARLAAGNADSAGEAAEQLAALAASSGMRLVDGRAHLAAARVALASGAPAAEHARRALVAFTGLAMPFDVAEARLELARALAGDEPELAAEEARSAFTTFQELGASRAMDGAAAVLRDLGSGTPARHRSHGELTVREQEVLGLIALGMSNAQIAQSLHISEKTAGHHVSRILGKLGVRNRAEAAAHAARAA